MNLFNLLSITFNNNNNNKKKKKKKQYISQYPNIQEASPATPPTYLIYFFSLNVFNFLLPIKFKYNNLINHKIFFFFFGN